VSIPQREILTIPPLLALVGRVAIVRFLGFGDAAATTFYAFPGDLLIPFNSNLPTGSTLNGILDLVGPS
jgi:hypothetical protein